MMNPFGMPQPDFGNPSIAPDSSPNFGVLNTASMPVKRSGMFGGRGAAVGDAIVGALNGYLAGLGNPAGIAGLQQLHQMRLLQQQQALADQQYQRDRQDKLTDAKDLYQFKLDHPEQAAPHYWEDNTGNLMEVGPDGLPRQVYKDPNPWKLVPNGMGGVIPVNMQELMGGAQPEIIQTLPKGAKPIGGPTPPASGGFPGY